MPSEKRWWRYPVPAGVRRFYGLDEESAKAVFGRRDLRTKAKDKRGRLIATVFAALAVAIILIAIPFRSEPIAVDDPEGTRRADMTVSAKELRTAFETNRAEAQKLYGNRKLKVSGTVAEGQLYLMNESFLLLGRSSEDVDAQVEITEAAREKAAKLLKGDEVEFVCQNVSQVAGAPVLDGCDLVSWQGKMLG